MPFVDPQTVNNPTAGQPATAAWGDAVRDAAVYLATNKPRCRVYRTTTQSISHNTETAVLFDAERYDVGTMHSTSTNTDRITIPTGEAGIYTITANVSFASNATGFRSLHIRVNGTTNIASISVTSISGTSTPLSLSTDYTFSAGDYVTMIVYQNSGGALNVNSTGNASPEFSALWQATT